MTWWQTLIIALAPVLVTTGALLKQQQWAHDREDRVRYEARLDVHLESLRAVHVEMLAALTALWRPSETYFRELLTTADGMAHLPHGTEVPLDRTRVDSARIELALTANDDEIARADEAIAAVVTTLSLLRAVVDDTGNLPVSSEQVRKYRTGTDDAIRLYEKAARDAVSPLRASQAARPAKSRR